MPAKKNKSKSKKKPGVIYSPPEDFVERLHAAQNWQDVADLLCEWLDIPDLETRQGLKKAHKGFDDIVAKLEKLWGFAVRTQHHDLAGGVIAIYSRVCVDAVLRNRIVENTDYLQKLFSLIEQPGYQDIALEALAATTHHGGSKILAAIAERVVSLLQVLDDHIDNNHTRKYAWTVLSHAGRAVLAIDKVPNASAVRSLDVPRMIHSALECMRLPQPSRQLAEHILSFFSNATRHCSREFFANPSAINFLLSCARNKDIRIRAGALGALLRLNVAKGKVEDIQFDPNKFLSAMKDKRWPDHIVDTLMDFGMMQCDTMQIASTTRDLQQSMMRIIQDHDFLRLGRELSGYIMRTEYSISQGSMQVRDPRTGLLRPDSCGLPFTWWLDALPYCARKLREDGGLPGDKDHADILDCKFFVTKRRVKEAHIIANSAIERGSHIGFFYYILTLDATKSDGLRIAKKGLKCKDLSNYVKFGLLYRAAEHAFELAQPKLEEAGNDQQALDEGYAFAHSAWEDTKNYIQNSPPDNRSMATVCHIHTLFSLLLYGHEHGPDMSQLKQTRHALRIADDVTRHVGRPITDTQLRLTANLIYTKMAEASKEWDAVTSCYGEYRVEPSEDKRENSLIAWLNKAEPEDVDIRGHTINEAHFNNIAVNLKDAALYRCSWCGNPSTILRKCRGCSMVRYCDVACQREHWTASHRKVCARKHENPVGDSVADTILAAAIAA